MRDAVSPRRYIEDTKISFARHVNNLFMEYSLLLALLAAERTLAEGVNAEIAFLDRFTSILFG